MYENERDSRKKLSLSTLIAIFSLILTFLLGLAFAAGYIFLHKDYQRKTAELEIRYQEQLSTISASYEEQLSSVQNMIKNTETVDPSLAELTLNQTSAAITTIAKSAKPSVVCITVTVPPSKIPGGFFTYDTETVVSTGSGVIYSSDGYILTNRHVIENAQIYSDAYITITLDDGTELNATLIAADNQTDIAVIRAQVSENVLLSPANFGNSDQLNIGEMVIAIGNPLGIEYANSVTVGFVSGLNRQVSSENGVETMIQTDAAINPGNSGGALLNSAGQVIGINTAKIASTDVEGIGFAIPIDTALKIAEDLIEHGYVKDRPAIGISDGMEITSTMARRYNLPEGFYIASIVSGSAAEQAGLRQGDVLLSFDGQSVSTLAEIEAIKKLHKVGDTVPLVYYRGGHEYTAKLTLTEDKG